MRTPSESLRDRWLDAAMIHIKTDGWTRYALDKGAEIAGLTDGEQALAAPGGVNDLIDHSFERAGDEMLAGLATAELETLRVHERVAAGLKAWLKALEPDKEAVRKAAGRGMLPWGVGAASKRVWRVADMVWEAAGDTATDYNRQTKRVLLSAIIPSIVLFWLRSEDEVALDAHIMKRLKQAMKLGQTGGKVLGPLLDAISKRRGAQAE